MEISTSFQSDLEVLEGLLKDLAAQQPIDCTLVNKACDALLFHIDMEEMLIYPVVQATHHSREGMRQCQSVHQSVREVIRDIFQSLEEGPADSQADWATENATQQEALCLLVNRLLERIPQCRENEMKWLFTPLPTCLSASELELLAKHAHRMKSDYLSNSETAFTL